MLVDGRTWAPGAISTRVLLLLLLWLLVVVCCWLFVVCCLLLVVSCCLFLVCCLLFLVVCCCCCRCYCSCSCSCCVVVVVVVVVAVAARVLVCVLALCWWWCLATNQNNPLVVSFCLTYCVSAHFACVKYRQSIPCGSSDICIWFSFEDPSFKFREGMHIGLIDPSILDAYATTSDFHPSSILPIPSPTDPPSHSLPPAIVILGSIRRSWPILTSALRSWEIASSSAASADEGTRSKCRESGSNGRVDDCRHPAGQRLPGLAMRCVEFGPHKKWTKNSLIESYRYILQDTFLFLQLLQCWVRKLQDNLNTPHAKPVANDAQLPKQSLLRNMPSLVEYLGSRSWCIHKW